MTYVEKMALKVWDYHDMAGCEEMVNQIIADTKRACKEVLYGEGPGAYELIDHVEVKEQEK